MSAGTLLPRFPWPALHLHPSVAEGLAPALPPGPAEGLRQHTHTQDFHDLRIAAAHIPPLLTMPLTLKIKPTLGGDTFPVQTEPEATIADLKLAVAEKVADTEASGLRLIYRGQILKDGQTVESYGERDRHMAKPSPP